MNEPESGLSATLQTEWFGSPISREIWDRIASLKKNGKQIPTAETMATDPVLSEKAQTILNGDLQTLKLLEIESAVEQLNFYRRGRLIFNAVEEVSNICKVQEPDLEKARQIFERTIKQFQYENIDAEMLSYGAENEKVMEAYERMLSINPDEKFIPTGFNQIDKQQGGLSRGRLYTIGAPSGGGKSTLANCMAVNMYNSKHSVGYFTFEMKEEECLARTQSYMSRIPHDRFQLVTLTKEDRKHSDKVLARMLAAGEAGGYRLDYVSPKTDLNLAQLFARIENFNYDVIVIDYINLMAPLNPKEPMWANLGEAFRLAKRFAEKHNCAVIMLVQVDEETGGIKYAKSIKHHSDGIWIWEFGPEQRESGLVEVQQIKLRNFMPIKFNLKAEFEYCSFTESYGAGAAPAPKPKGPEPMKL
jgi:replicative DNA helicase